MITTCTRIDWLEWTLGEGRRDSIWLQDALRYWEATQARNGYTNALKDPVSGMTLMWHFDADVHTTMGWHFSASGKAMGALRAHLSERLILQTLVHEGGDDLQVSRLDLALDVFNSGLRPSDLQAAEIAGLMRPRAKNRHYHEQTDAQGRTAQSWYIGSRKSRTGHYIVYEKGREMGDFNLDQLRIEGRHRQKRAKGVMNALLSSDDMHEMNKSLVKDALRPIDGALDFALDAPATHVKQEAKATDFDTLWHWCDRVAMGALKRIEAMRAGTVAELLCQHNLDGIQPDCE